jgi:hypothetical protein
MLLPQLTAFKKPQHELSLRTAKVANDVLLNHYKVMATSDDKEEAERGLYNLNRLKSCCLPGSSNVFKVIPLLDRTIPGPEFRIWSKLRLGYRIFKKSKKCDYCGDESDIYGQHLLKCGKVPYKGPIYRHNRFRDVVTNLCREIGCRAVPELNNLFDSSLERPADIYVENEATKLRLAIDVSLTSPHISSNKSIDSPIGYAANLRQNTKAQKYGDRLNQVGMTCAPLVFEHYGGFTTFVESAIINKFASTWVQNHPEYSWDFCKKNVIDRLTLEHAKIIVEIFVHRTRLKRLAIPL